MDTTTYSPPVDKLLTYGEAEPAGSKDWPNYLEPGFGPEHIPDLIRLATNTALRKIDDENDSPEYWAPVHAWRTLGQLHAEAAIEPLLPLFHELPGDEWVAEELPEVYGMIGPAAIPAVAAYIADPAHKGWPRINAMGCLEHIADLYPETRTECAAILTRQLESFEENEEDFNAFLIATLTSMKAQEALPLIEQAFEADRVDQFVIDWNFVQEQFGLKEREDRSERIQALLGTPPQPPPLMPEESIATPVFSRPPSPPLPRGHTAASTKKAKKKMGKASRKKNRKRR
jgi:hypothetical protein